MDAKLRKFLVEELKKLMLSTGMKQTLKWGSLAYEKSGMVCSIVEHKDHLNLQFWRGSELADPNGHLKGTGKRMRHLKVCSQDDIDSRQIASWIDESVSLNKKA